MAVMLKQVETVGVAGYPPKADGLSPKADALDPGAVWSRIEQWVAYRWTPREVVWTVEGDGDWTPPLAPVIEAAAEVWRGGAFVPVALSASPLGGYILPDHGPYRITATVGAGEVPAAVQEAYRRLAEYSADGQTSNMLTGRPGASSHTGQIGGDLSESIERNPAWLARALAWSGAADLLRPYRRA
ncbi:hypothetical protein [Jannaschia marina]|uniref:hypothetical protein n=1 Tax=Jannaschia marina TaxID=2741674 RepID=UPI0015C7229E|nr:hypothetical protein [Jannaschia marina]